MIEIETLVRLCATVDLDCNPIVNDWLICSSWKGPYNVNEWQRRYSVWFWFSICHFASNLAESIVVASRAGPYLRTRLSLGIRHRLSCRALNWRSKKDAVRICFAGFTHSMLNLQAWSRVSSRTTDEWSYNKVLHSCCEGSNISAG